MAQEHWHTTFVPVGDILWPIEAPCLGKSCKDAVPLVLVVVEDQYLLTLIGFDDLGQCVQLGVVEGNCLTVVVVYGTTCHLEQLTCDGCGGIPSNGACHLCQFIWVVRVKIAPVVVSIYSAGGFEQGKYLLRLQFVIGLTFRRRHPDRNGVVENRW